MLCNNTRAGAGELNFYYLGTNPIQSAYNLSTPSSFLSLEVNDATDTLCPTLTTQLLSKILLVLYPQDLFTDHIRMSTKYERSLERKWHKSRDANGLGKYQSLLSAFSSSVTAIKQVFYQEKG